MEVTPSSTDPNFVLIGALVTESYLLQSFCGRIHFFLTRNAKTKTINDGIIMKGTLIQIKITIETALKPLLKR